MQYTFLSTAGVVLFVRDDAEQSNWTQEEYTLNATFPYIAGKVIERGQRVCFRDRATNNIEVFEVRNVTNIEPDHYQQIIAENIAVSELSDDHINNVEITDKTPAQALATVLTGTLWSVGNSTVTDTQNADISRGSVWQAVCSIAQNWNAYITPRLTFSTAGAITGRYLDIVPAQGVWRGVRLSMLKNVTDASVVIDDSEVYTALYGYGGSVDVPHTGSEDTTAELTFADVVWTATSEHPAKPDGQTYLEDPAKTALYGRNGRARFGYYQNSNIKDATVLLQKTWETLQQVSSPKVSITGTVSDLYRLGYKDEPLRLHDTVIFECEATGATYQLEVIRNSVDLIDPTATRPEIGSYIPNIIYINRDIDEKAGGGGGGGSHGQDNKQHEDGETYTEFVKNKQMIGMVVGTYNGGYKVKGGEIALAINEQDASTAILLQADVIDIDGLVAHFEAEGLSCGDLDCQGSLTVDQNIDCEGTVSGYYGSFETGLTVGEHAASWQTYSARFCTLSNAHYFLYASSSTDRTPSGSASGHVVSSYTDTTLHYLGY